MANLLDQKVKFLRNAIAYATYELAKTAIIEKVQSLEDGEIVLATYVDDVNGNNGYRTILGVSRGEKGYEIFDNKAANDAIKALDATVENESEDKHVKVNIVETDGILTSVTVTTSDIASAALLGNTTDNKTKETAFGYIAKEVADRTAAIEALDVASNTVNGTNVHVTYKEEDGIVTVQSVAEDYATVTRTATSSSETTPKTDAALTVKAGDEGKLIKASDLANVAAYAADKVTEEEHRVDEKIANLGGNVTSDDNTFVTVQVKTSAGEVSDVIVTQDMQAVASADDSHTGLAEASDVRAYVDSKSAAASTTVKHGAGIEVTESEKEDGHVEYQVASNLIFQYNASSAGSAATITLKSAVREGETQVTYGTVNVSDIIGNGMLQSGSYNHETGILTLVFNTASGGTQTVTIDLASLLDIDDMIVGENSQKYFEVKTVTGEGDVHNFQLDVKIKNVTDATAAVTGLADAFEVKTYVDQKASDLAVTAEGDDYVSASVDATEDNKKVIVDTNVQNVTASAGTRGKWTVSDAGVATLEGETAPSISGAANSLMDGSQAITSVKTYVDAKVAAEAAERAAKIEGAIKALDFQDTAIENQYISKVDEVDGKVQLTRTALPVISVASDNSSVNVTNTSGAVNVQVHVDNDSIVVCTDTDHKGELTVGTIDCGTY